MNGVPEVNPLRTSSCADDLSYSRPKSWVRLTLVRGLLVCALTVAATYPVKAGPTGGEGAVANALLKTDHAGIQARLEKGAHKLNLDSRGVILKGYDPVAYFTQKKAVKGNPKYETKYQGATYYFSSIANLATYKRKPF